jgi:hypothetical protein
MTPPSSFDGLNRGQYVGSLPLAGGVKRDSPFVDSRVHRTAVARLTNSSHQNSPVGRRLPRSSPDIDEGVFSQTTYSGGVVGARQNFSPHLQQNQVPVSMTSVDLDNSSPGSVVQQRRQSSIRARGCCSGSLSHAESRKLYVVSCVAMIVFAAGWVTGFFSFYAMDRSGIHSFEPPAPPPVIHPA